VNRRPDIQIVSRYRISTHGTTQLRCVQPAEVLRDAGYSVALHNINTATPIARRLIILHRVSLNNYTRNFITCAQARGIPLIYDTDDLVFDADGIDYLSQRIKAKKYTAGWKPYADVMAICDAVTVSTDFLGTRARKVNPNTHVILNTLSKDYLKTAGEVAEHRDTTPRKGVTMAYLSGSRSHDRDFATIEDALIRALRKYPKTLLLLVGPLDVSEKLTEFKGRIIRQGFKPYSEFPQIFKDVDINLIPLEADQAFCHAKSELKFIEAAACGVASIAAPTEPHIAAITHGQNGMLATTDWDSCLDALIKDSALRDRLGVEAKRLVEARYTPQECRQAWEKVIPSVVENQTVKKIGHRAYLTSRAIMTLHNWRYALHRWLLNKRNSLLGR